MRLGPFALLIVLMSCSTNSKKEEAPIKEVDLKVQAQELAKKLIILDGHVDLPYRLKGSEFDIDTDKGLIISSEKGDFDYNKAVERYLGENSLFTNVQKVADHIDHVVKLAGIDHVGFGSDYDGVGDSLPVGLKDVSDFPNLIEELLRRGYSEEDIEKICYKNVFRVWKAVDKLAGS